MTPLRIRVLIEAYESYYHCNTSVLNELLECKQFQFEEFAKEYHREMLGDADWYNSNQLVLF